MGRPKKKVEMETVDFLDSESATEKKSPKTKRKHHTVKMTLPLDPKAAFDLGYQSAMWELSQ